MKPLRILLVGAAIFAAILGLVVALAFTPSVQTWAARRGLAQQPDLRGEIGRIAVGLDQVNVAGLRIERQGIILTLPSATIDLPLSSAAKKRVLIHRAVAKGWILDLTAAVGRLPSGAPDRVADSSQLFEGIFKMLALPMDLQVDAVDLEGDVLFPTKPGEPPGRTHLNITGGGLGSGQTGAFKIVSVAKLSTADAPVSEVTSETLVQAKMDTPRTFEWMTGAISVSAEGPKFPRGAKLKGDLKAQHTGQTEEYTFIVRSAETSGEKQVIDLHGNYPGQARALTGTWKVNASDSDFAALALGVPLPGFVAIGEGRFEADSAFHDVHASGTFETSLSKLENINPTLAVVGQIRVKAEFDLVRHEQVLRIARLSADLQGAKPIASIVALQAIELNSTSGKLMVVEPAKDLFRIKIEGVPLAWGQALLPNLTMGGEDLRGEIVASARDDGLTVRSLSPLTIKGLSVSNAAGPLIRSVDLSAGLTADYSPSGWQAEVTEMVLRTAETSWATFSAKAGSPAGKEQPLKATGQYHFDLPAALRQPALARLGELTRGSVAGDFSVVVTPRLKQLGAKLEVRDLASAAAAQGLPSLTINIRADLQADGLIKLQAPLVIQQGDRKSDLDFSGQIQSAGAQQRIDAQLQSSVLYVEDLQLLAAPFQATPRGAAPRPSPGGGIPAAAPSNQVPDTVPFWNGLSGQLRLALKKVIYSPDVQAADISGAVKIGADAVTLDQLHAILGEESSAAISGGVSFDHRAKDPYALKGDLNVTNLNPGPILGIISPQHEPTVEGQFDLVGKFSGEAPRADALADRTSAEIKLTSRGGKFNGFAAGARATDVGKLQKATSTAATLLGLASGIIGENKVTMYAERVRAISDIFKRFIQIDFDQLNLELSHRPGEETKIKDFSLISPNLRFVGTGVIEDVAGKSWWDQPLHLVLDMAVRGAQADDMKLLGALQDTKDPLGYVPLAEKVPIDGTLSNLGTSSLMKYVMKFAPR